LTLTGTTDAAAATAGCFAESGFFAWATAGAVVRVRNAGTTDHTHSGARFMGDLQGIIESTDRRALRPTASYSQSA
jgi:hypothetical protein